eukprot:Cvel_7387.t1-p1 / transcript=Cvel_7387.t1 / gene=Cvel_7387 / organism=Chromera_velia_CCMP2878 / gene_product=hypothetical protein / transcript_product=hypothetical protein / location=Cvel_scaffold384:87796-93096(+) / protein_length=573 / sequence_SO=supercontig / SO=protein_coding / is_pseudo=false
MQQMHRQNRGGSSSPFSVSVSPKGHADRASAYAGGIRLMQQMQQQQQRKQLLQQLNYSQQGQAQQQFFQSPQQYRQWQNAHNLHLRQQQQEEDNTLRVRPLRHWPPEGEQQSPGTEAFEATLGWQNINLNSDADKDAQLALLLEERMRVAKEVQGLRMRLERAEGASGDMGGHSTSPSPSASSSRLIERCDFLHRSLDVTVETLSAAFVSLYSSCYGPPAPDAQQGQPQKNLTGGAGTRVSPPQRAAPTTWTSVQANQEGALPSGDGGGTLNRLAAPVQHQRASPLPLTVPSVTLGEPPAPATQHVRRPSVSVTADQDKQTTDSPGVQKASSAVPPPPPPPLTPLSKAGNFGGKSGLNKSSGPPKRRGFRDVSPTPTPSGEDAKDKSEEGDKKQTPFGFSAQQKEATPPEKEKEKEATAAAGNFTLPPPSQNRQPTPPKDPQPSSVTQSPRPNQMERGSLKPVEQQTAKIPPTPKKTPLPLKAKPPGIAPKNSTPPTGAKASPPSAKTPPSPSAGAKTPPPPAKTPIPMKPKGPPPPAASKNAIPLKVKAPPPAKAPVTIDGESPEDQKLNLT